MNEVDESVIATIQKALPNRLIIVLPSPESSDVTMFYCGMKAVIRCESIPPMFIVQSLCTDDILDWGQEPTVVKAIVSAYLFMQSKTESSSDGYAA
jgi:hypothetical protein